MTDFYIFRHGESTYNVAGRTQGCTNNSELTTSGIAQAEEIGRRLQGKSVEIIISSPLKRALQTAELANKSLNVTILKDKRFIEVDVGEVEGWPREDIKNKYPELFKQWHQPGQDEICYPGGETRKQVRQRVFEGLNEWAKKTDYQCIAISSHGIMLGEILVALKQTDCRNIPNAAILHIKCNAGVWEIVEWIA